MNSKQKECVNGSVEHLGCCLRYQVQGSGPPVVFIQGTGLHGRGWLPQVDELCDRYQCLIFDNRGMGASQPMGAKITVEQMAEDVLVLMDHLGWDSAHVAGHSLGGTVALHLALSARQRMRSLALICTFSRGADATRMTWRMFWLGLRTCIGTRGMRRRAFTRIVLPPNVGGDRDKWAEKLASLFGHDLADHPPVVMKQMAALRAYDATPRLSALAGLPALVLSAGHDLIARPEAAQRLAKALPGCKSVLIDQAAHGVTIQCAEEVNRLLDRHFADAEHLLPSSDRRGETNISSHSRTSENDHQVKPS